jgi:adhesin transport system membrane fusion protein
MEAGLLAELMVKEGDTVEASQPLLRIDDVKLGANVQESQSRVDAMLASAARLRAESRGGEPVFSTDLMKRNPELVKVELGTLQARRRSLDASVQAQQQALRLAQDELKITEPLAAKGLVSDIDVLRIRRSVAESKGRIDEAQSKYRADAAAELARVEAELGSQSATLVGRTDSLNRTVLRAPKRGVVKNIRVTTIGAVVQSGQDILEIVPMDDVLLVETRIRPSDIAFLRPGLPAVVKISAYDSGVYGWLEGQVQQISPDTLHDEVRKDETYYRAVISTRSSVLRTPNGQVLPIIPGMQAQVDIKTGQKSVLSYLFKPVLRAREALRER